MHSSHSTFVHIPQIREALSSFPAPSFHLNSPPHSINLPFSFAITLPHSLHKHPRLHTHVQPNPAGLILQFYEEITLTRQSALQVSLQTSINTMPQQLTLSPSPQKKFLVRMFWYGYSVRSSRGGMCSQCAQCSFHRL